MRIKLLVSLCMAIVVAIPCRAGETRLINGYECRESIPNWAVRLHSTGTLKSCYLASPHAIDGVPCAEATRANENRARRKATTVAAVFHPNGRLRQCQVAKDFTRDGRDFRGGDTIRLAEDGSIVDDNPEVFAIVYPTLIRTDLGTSFDLVTRDLLAATLSETLQLEVRVSDRELAFRMPETTIQWQLFQAGIDSLGDQLGTGAEDAEFHIVMELLVTTTRSGGEAIAGIEYYVFDENTFGDWSGITTSDQPSFARARLNVRSAREHADLLRKAARFGAIESTDYFKPIAENWSRR